MATRAEVIDSLENVKVLHQRYKQSCDQGACAGDRRWEALHEAQGNRKLPQVLAAQTMVADADAASAKAFEEFARALVELRALGLPGDVVRPRARPASDDTDLSLT